MAAADRIAVLFVCHGNICRSPLAAAIFAHKVRERGLTDRFRIESAGTWAMEGREPHPYSIEVARAHGVELSSRSRPIVPDDLVEFDHVIAMDRANEADILRLQRYSAFGAVEDRTARVRLLRSIGGLPARGVDLDVPDPIGHALDRYVSLWDVLEPSCERLLDEIRATDARARR